MAKRSEVGWGSQWLWLLFLGVLSIGGVMTSLRVAIQANVRRSVDSMVVSDDIGPQQTCLEEHPREALDYLVSRLSELDGVELYRATVAINQIAELWAVANAGIVVTPGKPSAPTVPVIEPTEDRDSRALKSERIKDWWRLERRNWPRSWWPW